MAKNNALPIVIGAGALLLFMGGGKKSKKASSGGRIQNNFGDYGSPGLSVDVQQAQAAINRFPNQLWVIVQKNEPQLAEIRGKLKAAAARLPGAGFALVNCDLFVPYEGPEACQAYNPQQSFGRAGSWEWRNSSGETLREGPIAGLDEIIQTFLSAGAPDGANVPNNSSSGDRSALLDDFASFGELWEDIPEGFSIAIVADLIEMLPEAIDSANQHAIDNPDQFIWLIDRDDYQSKYGAAENMIIAKNHATGQESMIKLTDRQRSNAAEMRSALIQASQSM